MKTQVLLIWSFLYLSISFSFEKTYIQSNSFELVFALNSSNYSDIPKGKFTVRDYFEFTDPSKAGQFKLPSHYFVVAIPPNSKPQISLIEKKEHKIFSIVPKLNPKLVKTTDSTFSLIEVESPLSASDNAQIIELVGYTWYRDFYCAVIKLNQGVYNTADASLTEYDSIKIQFSFDKNNSIKNYSPIQANSPIDIEIKQMIYNWEIAEQFRAKPNFAENDSTFNWINFNYPYLKLSVGEDGIYRILPSDLESFGISLPTINPRTFQLYKKGKEVPIFVNGEEDNSFDINDYIEFFGEKNYPEISHRVINSQNEDYNEFLNRYTDSSFYFLTWNQNDGKRISIQNNTFNSSDTIGFYKNFIHVESNASFQNHSNNDLANQTPDWKNNKTWSWQWIFTLPRTFSFAAADIYPGKPASIFVKLISAGSNIAVNSHNVALKLNGVTLDSQVVNRFQQVLLQGSMSSNSLINGTNQIGINNYANGTTVNLLGLDWYDIEYPKYLNLINDSLLFEVNDQLVEKPININIGNAANSNLIVYKVKNSIKKFENYDFLNNIITLYDTATDGDKYIVLPENKILKPAFLYFRNFEDLSDSTLQTEYLAITHPIFYDAVNNYTNIIGSIRNLKTKVVNTFSIYDQFGFGYPTPESIKLFILNVFSKWKSPAPSYLTLFGDANYDFKGYILKSSGVRLGENYVPSYGTPVGDNWFVIFEDSILPVPQMKVGRIPINNEAELNYYLNKILDNHNSEYDEWNKSSLFFSGGTKDEEYATLKSSNDSVIYNLIQPKPLAGIYHHFYKTANPNTDFGPFTPEQIRNAIDNGGVFISYVGHSGTATWDNSINNSAQLKNKVNKYPLITDFGCSTNKFAEPDIICFGERFLFEASGQALGYVGNSSLGFLTSAITVPKYFYKSFLIDSTEEVGNAHLYSKFQLFELFGNSETNKIYSLTNCILGDPTVQLKLPKLTNLKLNSESLLIDQNQLVESNDSVQVNIVLKNLGISTYDSLNIQLIHSMNNELIQTKVVRIALPDYIDTVSVYLLIKNLAGQHTVSVKVDSDNEFSEIYENDNEVTSTFTVYTTQLRDLADYDYENSSVDTLLLLNPINHSSSSFEINLQTSDNQDFSNVEQYTISAGKFFTLADLDNLQPQKRIWFRYKINEANSDFGKAKSFIAGNEFPFLLADSLSFTSQKLSGLQFNGSSLKLSNDSIDISVLSAGFYSGATCVIAQNGVNLLSNSFFAGMGIVVFDPITMNVDTSTWYTLFAQPANVQALADLINSVPEGKIVVMGVADDAKTNLSVNLKNAIKSLGSTKIDSLLFRGSWAIIGKKGAPAGSVIEQVRGPYDGSILIDSSFVVKNQTGSFITRSIGPANSWNSLKINDLKPSDSDINYTIFGKRLDGQLDTLHISIADSITNFSLIDSKIYPELILEADLSSSAERISPEILSLGVDYEKVPELGTNYQVVSIDKDSIYQTDSLNLSFLVYNIGSPADSFRIKVDLLKANNSKRSLFVKFVDRLESMMYDSTNFVYHPQIDDGTGRLNFLITIDEENTLLEKYKDNNFYLVNFTIKPDTTITSVSESSLAVTFDGVEILDGDYISNTPIVRFVLNYPVWFRVEDTTAVQFYLNQNQIYYSQLNIQHDTSNKRLIFTYSPQLEEGEYNLRVFGKTILGVLESTPGYDKYFIVSNDAELLQVYNYPNPIKDQTYFTFRLTQQPDELKILIFTVAGRLVKQIVKYANDLSVDFNKIYWDTRDEDGDLLANGTYLYKIILKQGDKIKNITQKLAIVR